MLLTASSMAMSRILFSISASGRGNLEREPGHPTSELLALLCFGLFNEFGVGDFHAAPFCTARYRAMAGDQRARDRGRHGVADTGHCTDLENKRQTDPKPSS